MSLENKIIKEDINLSLGVNEINLILFALGELPAKNVMDLLLKVRQQASEQVKENDERS